MRYFTFLAFLCLAFGGAAVPVLAQPAEQVAHVQLQWKGYTEALSRGNKIRKVPTFYGASFRPNELVGAYLLRLEGRVGVGQLRNAVYEPFSAADAQLFEAGSVTATPAVGLSTGLEQHRPVSIAAIPGVRLSPQTGQPEKLISCDYVYSLTTDQVQARASKTRTYTATSALSQGEWFKIGVPASGIYKLNRDALKTLGLNVDALDLRFLKVYGNGVGMLPQLNRAYRPDDLVENPIFVADAGNNNKLDADDYLLFYARGPHTWSRDALTQSFHHVQNIYTDTAYYFVTVGTTPGRRVAAAPAVTSPPTASISKYAYRDYHEVDLVNLIRSGRQWLGEGFNNTTAKEIPFATPDLVPGSPLLITSSTAANSVVYTKFDLAVNDVPLGSQNLSRTDATDNYPEAANTDLQTFSTNLSATPPATIRVKLTYSGAGDPSAQGYLDYLELNAQRQLRLTGSQLDFRSFQNIGPTATSQFVLAAPGATVWEVTNPRRPRSYALDGAGNFVARTDSVREFVAFTGSNFDTPRFFGRVANQNLHALNLDQKLDLVIVTYPPFLPEAERLAEHRRTHDGLTARVVTTTQVYNEFSSGGQDITAIRDLMKMVYDRAPAGKDMFLLLFGDASYDYKADPTNDLTKLPAWWKERAPFNGDKGNQNFVPTYQSRESFTTVHSRSASNPPASGLTYCSDDYFGLLDDTDGFWNENGIYNASPDSVEMMDIGVGRLPIRTPLGQPSSRTQAAFVVDKIISYDQPRTYGKWRNRLTFVADDGNGNYHVQVSTETPAQYMIQQHPEYNIHKVYLDLYPQTIAAAGQYSPECNRAIDESIEQGSLVVEYSGHGGPDGWADEQIVTHASVLNLQNRDRLTFMLTATCDFSTYDNPEKNSAGEQALTDTPGGAAGLLTTTRLSFTGSNDAIVKAFYETAFTPSNGSMPRTGDILRATKNASISATLNRNFVLLGDPSMRLAYPEQQITLDSLNSHAVSATRIDTLKSLSTVTLVGRVRNGAAVNANFSGKAQVTVYEKPSIVNTLGNQDPSIPISVQENVIYDGQATVRAGAFKVKFVVPRDINFSLGLGKVSLYASDSLHRVDAHGARTIPVGGANPAAALDTIPPRVRLFMDNEAFVFGGLTGTATTLLANLSDKSGINTAGSGIGHEITATLDNDPSKLIILNEFYTANVDSFQSGKVKYLFKELSTGPHILRLKAWDTYNNSAEKEIEFIAASTDKLALQHVLNYPNPFSTNTTFHFDHNRSGDDLDIQVQIFTVAGRLVRTLRTSVLGSDPHFKALTWNGRDEYDDQLARGVYVYRVSVKSQRDGSTASKYEKLVILN